MKKVLVSFFLIAVSLSAFAVCQGTSAEHDAVYYNADPGHKDWVNGYTYTMRVEGTNVIVTFASLDNFAGAVAPYIFLNPGTGSFREMQMQGAYNNASVTIDGYSAGDTLSFMFKLPVAGGSAYSKIITYVIGEDCGDGGGDIDDGGDVAGTACSGTSTELDAFFTQNDAAACRSLEKGYTYRFETTANGVELKMNFLDEFVGFAAPYAFVFTSESDENLYTEIPLQNVGQLVFGTFTGLTEGQTLKILVKIAYAEHVLFTHRLTYVAGTKCEEASAVEVIHGTTVENDKFIRDGKLYIVTGGNIYDAIGRIVEL